MAKVNTVSVTELLKSLYKDLPQYLVLSDLLQAQVSTEIASARIEKGMNQSQFAAFMGVTQSQVSKWENGDFNFTIEKLCEIADKLDMICKVSLSPKRKAADYKDTNITLLSDYANTASRYQAKSIEILEG